MGQIGSMSELLSALPTPNRFPPPWGVQHVVFDEIRPIRVGPRDLWIGRSANEIRVASAAAEAEHEALAPEPPSTVQWSRLALSDAEAALGEGLEISVLPAFPSRTLIVEPEDAFSLRPRAEARVFVRIPLTVQVVLGDSGGTAVFETPTLELSDTWWGGVMYGELCSWLGTHARRRVDGSLLEAHLAICPLHLVNESGQDLRVERLAFRPEFLSLFAQSPGFWADESRIRYQGAAEGSQMETFGKAPEEAEGAVLVRGPRTSPRGGGVRPLSRLIGLAGIGGAG